VVYRRRCLLLALSLILLVLSAAGARHGGQLTSGGPITSGLESGRASLLLKQELKSSAASRGSSFILILGGDGLKVSDPRFEQALDSAVAPLARDPHVSGVVTPYSAPPAQRSTLVSGDGRSALVLVQLRDSSTVSQRYYPQIRGLVHSPVLSIQATGQVPIELAFNSTLESDLHRAEFISLPLTLLMLLLIFATVIAASLPLAVGVLAIAGGSAAALVLARYTDVSQYALNIVTLIGLAVAIDYSLFVVSRFRDEIGRGESVEDAIATTLSTAGRAIAFSGVTVAIGLSAMLFYQGTFLASMGVAGALVVGIAVFYGLTFLPALLCVLGPRVGWLQLPIGRPRAEGGGLWNSWARWVMRRPALVAAPALALLLLTGAPFLHLRMAGGNADQLPQQVPARRAYDQLTRFPGQNQTSFQVVFYYPQGDPLSSAHLADEYRLTRDLSRLPGVEGVSGPLSIAPNLSLADYQQLYSSPPAARPAQVQSVLLSSTGTHLMEIQLLSSYPPTSDAARALLDRIRSAPGLHGGQVLVTGSTASDVDVIDFILSRTPSAVLFVVLVTYLVLFLLTGSVVLPLKAVVLNLISISASFGALVFVFQDGHLASLLNFTPQSIDPTVPVLLFSIVFGMSMDYEVLLVSRIQEEYGRSHDAAGSIAVGLERSGRLISGAAAIMITVFFAFGLAQVVVIKSIGLGLAAAVAIDATVVRLIVVPSVMRLLGDWAWWSPPWLRRIHARIGLA